MHESILLIEAVVLDKVNHPSKNQESRVNETGHIMASGMMTRWANDTTAIAVSPLREIPLIENGVHHAQSAKVGRPLSHAPCNQWRKHKKTPSPHCQTVMALFGTSVIAHETFTFVEANADPCVD